jgi:hypothetical protein
MPGIGPLYNPPPPFVSPLPSLLSSVADVRHVPSFENLACYLWKIVPLAKVQVSGTSLVDAQGNVLAKAKPGQQVSIASTFKNQQQKEQPYAFIVQITDKDGFTADLGWQIGKVQAGQKADLSRSWTIAEPGTYKVTIFVWDSVSGKPVPLTTSTVMEVRAS